MTAVVAVTTLVAVVVSVGVATRDVEREAALVASASTTTAPATTTTVAAPLTTTAAVALESVTTLPPVPASIELSGSAGPLDLKVTITPGVVVAGQPFVVRHEVSDAEGGRFAYGGGFGDDVGPSRPRAWADCVGERSESPEREPSSEVYEVEYTYRLPGLYFVELVVASYDCDRPQRMATVKHQLVVAPGLLLSNGPKLPEIEVVDYTGDRYETPTDNVFLVANAADLDGYVTSLVIDWGDGGPASVTSYPLSACQDPGERFPRSSEGFEIEHAYATPGTYTVRLSATSSGCDGSDEQSSQKEIVVTAP